MTIRLLAIAVTLLMTMPAWSSSKDPTPAAAVGRAVRALQQEVKKDDPQPPRSKRDFFKSFEFETDGEEAAKRLEEAELSGPAPEAPTFYGAVAARVPCAHSEALCFSTSCAILSLASSSVESALQNAKRT